MKKFTLILALAFWAMGCHAAKPDAGIEAVLIQKPVFFGHGGVVDQPVRTGQQWVALSTDIVYVSVQPIQFEVKFNDLMSADGVPLDFDSFIRLQVTDSVALLKNFGPQWYNANVQIEFSNRVRQAVRKHGMNETAISTVAIDAIDQEVTNGMSEYIKNAGLPLRLVQITIGRANPPDSIKSQRIETATQQQRQHTEQERKLAEDQRMGAEHSRAEADNAYRTAMQLSPEQFLALETIKMQREACKDGHCTFIVGAKVTPIVDAGKN